MNATHLRIISCPREGGEMTGYNPDQQPKCRLTEALSEMTSKDMPSPGAAMSASAAPKLENVLRRSRLFVDATPNTFWKAAGKTSVSFPIFPVDETQVTPRPVAWFMARISSCDKSTRLKLMLITLAPWSTA